MSTTNNATGGDDGQENKQTPGTAADDPNKDAGDKRTPGTPPDDKNKGGGKIEFTPEQQEFINNLVKSEKEKEVNKAKSKWEADAKLTEDQRKDAQLAELRKQLRDRDARDEVLKRAKAQGAKNPELIHKIVAADLEFDDENAINNLDDLLKRAAKDFPDQFGPAAPTPEGGADGGEGKGRQQPAKAETLADALRNHYKKNQ